MLHYAPRLLWNQKARCTELKTLLRGHSAFALKIPRLGAQLPHAKELKIQCGGLKGLQSALSGSDDVEDAYALIESALAAHGSLEDFPFSGIVQGVVHFEARRRG